MANLRKKLVNFLSGKYSEEGRAIYDAWYRSFDDSADTSLAPASPEKIQEELRQIKNHNVRTLSPAPPSFFYLKVAAALLVVGVTVSLIYLQWNRLSKTSDPVGYTEMVTPRGARMQITLSDGSHVWLNAETTLKYPEKFNGAIREVFLSGEAYFEVEKDKEHPFTIHSGNLTTTVLGTSFNIRAYPGGDNLEVAVITGKVSVANGSPDKSREQLLLTANQKAVLKQQSQELTMEELKHPEKYAAWKEGKLIAEDLSVANVIQMLNRTYDATIEAENEALGSCHITADFESMPLERVLDFLCTIVDATWTKKEGRYIIHGAGCANKP